MCRHSGTWQMLRSSSSSSSSSSFSPNPPTFAPSLRTHSTDDAHHADLLIVVDMLFVELRISCQARGGRGRVDAYKLLFANFSTALADCALRRQWAAYDNQRRGTRNVGTGQPGHPRDQKGAARGLPR
eukprot:353033-Chlamydomonas_euryale.AAC.5